MKNHPGLKNYDDIMKVDFDKIIEENGKVDVVIGGPPCQGFSNANRQRRHLIMVVMNLLSVMSKQ